MILVAMLSGDVREFKMEVTWGGASCLLDLFPAHVRFYSLRHLEANMNLGHDTNSHGFARVIKGPGAVLDVCEHPPGARHVCL